MSIVSDGYGCHRCTECGEEWYACFDVKHDCGWRPIATAPKGDIEILLYIPETPSDMRDHLVITGWWFSSSIPSDEGWETPIGFIGEPSHWMPLLPLPVQHGN